MNVTSANGAMPAAALEYARHGIRINAICPGATLTELMHHFIDKNPSLEKTVTASVPMGRIGRPQEIAEAVVWLCSDAASFITGHAMAVDGGTLAR